ncbi:PEP-CTERM/exosortase system-associated acyltransferase [Colwellia sp. TT2012]|uniref:PEP-CTERM/exosortase system-associated acyltransferase n=1 Tax=Colwellia sp. TT2012 TaxID=1720342 RepID=UPI00070D2F3A|nr:PEP-CTERM/exosortase system-associated acyltransferase [Colwellia sp. TT2012]
MNWNQRFLSTPIIANITKKIVSARASREAHSISKHFTQFLQPHVAVDQALKEEAFKIRHNVYCEELAFEEVRENGQETDEFDEQSLFSLIKHKPSDTFTSCVRLVTSNGPEQLLPIEKYCLDSITNEALSPKRFNRAEIAEISRLAVKADFRRRKADHYKGSGTGVISEISYSETELRCFPFIAIGLYMAAATMGMNTGIRHVYVMMEPRLARSMKFIGISFQQLGPTVDYHGLRAPYYINPEIFMKDLSPGFKSLYKTIEKDICSQLKQMNLT